MPLNFPHTIHRTMSPQARAMRSGKHTTQLAGHLGDDAAAQASGAVDWNSVATAALNAGGQVAQGVLTSKYGTTPAKPATVAAAATSALPYVIGFGGLAVVLLLVMTHKHAG